MYTHLVTHISISIILFHSNLIFLFSISMQLLKDLDRIAGKSNLTEEMTRSWNDIWAPKIMKLKYHGRCTTTQAEIVMN